MRTPMMTIIMMMMIMIMIMTIAIGASPTSARHVTPAREADLRRNFFPWTTAIHRSSIRKRRHETLLQ